MHVHLLSVIGSPPLIIIIAACVRAYTHESDSSVIASATTSDHK